MEPRIQHVNDNLAKNAGVINKLRHYFDFHMLKQLYYTLIIWLASRAGKMN